MLNDVELLSMQHMMVIGVMPDRCTTQRKTQTRDGINIIEVWENTGVNIPCRIYEPTGVRSFEGESAGKLTSSAYPILRVPPTVDVNENDRVVVGNRTFEITRVVHNSVSFVTTLLTTEVR